MLKRMIFLIACILMIFSTSCTTKSHDEVWYISSDSFGSIVVMNEKEHYLLIAGIEMNDLSAYRGILLQEEIESDNLGALQSLFNLPFNHLVEGNKQDWKEVYKKPLSELNERVNYFVGSEDDLSKVVNPDTLESLSGKQTTVQDIKRLYNYIKNDTYVLRVYNVSQFFNPYGDVSINQRNIGEWMMRALEEIRNN